MNNINHLIDDYYNFLRSKTFLQQDEVSLWTCITTPFLGLFNDKIEIFAKKDNGKIILSDDGETIHNLELSGVSFSRSPKRRDMLDRILLNYGVELRNKEELTVEANENSFAQKKLNLLSAISEISDFRFLSEHSVGSLFRESVREYLSEQDVIFTADFISKGTTGLEFTFDFIIAYKQTEIVVKAFSLMNKNNLTNFLFSWEDILPERKRSSRKDVVAVAIINDEEQMIRPEYLEALDSRQADYIVWSKKDEPENIAKLKPGN